MRSSVALAVRAVAVGCGLAMMSGASSAVAVTGKYFDVEIADTFLPSYLWSAQVVDSADAMTTSLVIQVQPGSGVAIDAFSANLMLNTLKVHGPQVVGVDASGSELLAEVDFARWSMTAVGTLTKPADAIFMTSYGENRASISGLFRVYTKSFTQDISVPGQLTLTSVPRIEEPITFDAESGVLSRVLGFNHVVTAPHYAKPSTTNPRCESMSCLGFESGAYTPTSYTVTFALTPAVALAVPEAGTLPMMLLGLAVVGYGVRRRAAA